MGISFATALAANFQGQQLVADLDAKKAETANTQAMTQLHTAQGAEIQRKVEGEKQMGAWIASQQAANSQAFNDADQAAQTYSKGAQVAAASGQFDMMKQMQTMANSSLEQAKDARIELEKKTATAKEAAASSAISYVNDPSPANAVAMAKAYTAAGGNPVNIPQPGTMEFNAFAKNLQTSALSSKDNMARAEKQREFELTLQERQDNHKDQAANRQMMLSIQAQNQAGLAQYRQDSLELRRLMYGDKADAKADQVQNAKDKVAFQQTTKINNDVQKEAKPYLADRAMTQDVLGLLQENSPAADKQLQQRLTSLKTGIARATNLYYKDNKNFGDVSEKISGFLSQTFTGRYTEDQRKEIYDLVKGMQTRTIDPALRNLENDAKKQGERFKLDRDAINISGDFDRTGTSSGKTAKGGASVSGALQEAPTSGTFRTPTASAPTAAAPATPAATPAAPAATTLPTARNAAGQTIVFKDGKWQ